MKGTIFIPDMNGFTNFVNNININLGVSIIQDLLNEIIVNNPLQLELSEIEGDAILYYKEGDPICLNEIFAAFKKISEAFDELGYDTEPYEDAFVNEMILWRQYRKRLAKSNCEIYSGSTNFKSMYWFNMERITDERIDSLYKQNEALFFEAELHSKVQRFD